MLTAKQEKFCQNILKGMTQADAYRDAYNTDRMTDNAIYTEASLLADNPKISQRIQELRQQISSSSIMSAQERLQWLTDLVQDSVTNTDAKLRAMEIMNKMTGEYVTKLEADVKNEVTINVELVDD